jgi:hypothetical protein
MLAISTSIAIEPVIASRSRKRTLVRKAEPDDLAHAIVKLTPPDHVEVADGKPILVATRDPIPLFGRNAGKFVPFDGLEEIVGPRMQ